MRDQSVKRVVIAGGGTAGWCAAAALTSQLGPLIDVTLVESDDIGTVGVGEATIPTIRTFHHLLALDEREFMRATKASFKLAIMFENWARLGDRYIHSFGQVGKPAWMGGFHNLWLQARSEGFGGDLGDYCFELQAAKAGKFFTSEQSRINYAYHLDAGLYGRFLREFSEAKGAKRVEGRIREVEQRPDDGFIRSLIMESGDRVEGDLFIDCTGFRGLIIEQTLKAGYEDWSNWLPTDSAIAVQTRPVGPAPPYTRAIAHDAGWQWRIPLQHRVGAGIVYCSDFLSDDEARARLLGDIDGEAITEPRLIRYRTGKRRKSWIRNCVALGLSSGFVEPLESTSIHLIQIGLTRLIQLFPFSGFHDALLRRYNEQADVELERVRDFIILHYKQTERGDSPFWRRCRDMEIPDTLAQRMALFRDDAFAYQGPEDLFRVDSWLQVMLGQRLEPRGRHHMGRLMTRDQMRRALDGVKTNIAGAVAKMPSHQEFLDRYCSSAEA